MAELPKYALEKTESEVREMHESTLITIAAVDAIENLVEYAKKDILDAKLIALVEKFQEELIERRADLQGEMQTDINRARLAE